MDFDELLREARLGEGQAFAELWRRHAPRVAGFVRAGGARDVEEITSDVFTAAFGGIGRFEGDEAGFVALLMTIARRRVIDERRRRHRRVAIEPWQHDRDVTAAGSVEDDAVARVSVGELAEHLARLTQDQREVVLLRLVGDLSLEQTATVMGKRVGTVKSLQRRGLDALRRSLAAHPQVTRPAVPERKPTS
ncbi:MULTISPECIES: RNA polymerase sigma factor [unclassified Nocardioides]|uniref:RNA polymerase sigma factor n=1 Tax=unclassified Nocardioides TaxID=2615069 RepID=UPI0009F1254D|nr:MULTISPECIES: sigma-70 family RNA polymerase sigma factor [unclassified Nocardioides]GAW51878.1 sigma-70 region 4 domain-containing protein [Nocardioides sp. PD653-B2]GAW53468.1 sigma-70 region 4 domain-containing protein [Nocardioides sp. PD653]